MKLLQIYRIVHFRKFVKFQIITNNIWTPFTMSIGVSSLPEIFQNISKAWCSFLLYMPIFLKIKKILLHYHSIIIKIMILTMKYYCHLIYRSYSDFTNCLINLFYSKRKESGSESYITCYVSFFLSWTFP